MKQVDAATTWDMLQSWTNLDITQLTGHKINTPENVIYMTHTEHLAFGAFRFYFDADAVSLFPYHFSIEYLTDIILVS